MFPRHLFFFAGAFKLFAGLTRVVGFVLLAGLVTGPASAADGAAAPAGRWADHPALQSFELAGKELPANLFLVRTSGELPPAPGIVVHARRNGVFVVSGDPETVLGLVQKGCAVVPLRDAPAAATHAARRWEPVLAPDPNVAAMVAEVDWTGVSAKIQWLVDFGTRHSFATNHAAVADSIAEAFAGLGLTPIKDSFVYNSRTIWNVEAVQTGTVYPDSFYIICGHFDDTSEAASHTAPGADDNGTGTAAVLTAAEILTQRNFEYSIRYICFGGEEQGLRGSADYAAKAAASGMGIVGVLNFDMLGYWETGVPKDLEIETNVASQWLAAAIINAANLYTSAPYILHVDDGAWWGDHASFWAEGYAAVNHEEAWDWGDPDFNPYYHTTNDLLIHVDPDFTVGNIQVGVAALATLAVYVPDATGVDEPVAPPMFAGSLSAYPNPFGERINFTVTGVPGRERVDVVIYDALGRRVDSVPVVLHDGRGSAVWRAVRGAGPEIRAGVYFGKLEGIPHSAPVKFVHVK